MADDRPSEELESREPTVEDLRDLCRALNERGARYVVIGGFAIRAANYNRRTMDIDLIVAADPEHAARKMPPTLFFFANGLRNVAKNRPKYEFGHINTRCALVISKNRIGGPGKTFS